METKPTETAKVDEFMSKFEHPLKELLEALRKVILSTDPEIGEEIKWNSPTFFYTGPQAPSDAKEFKRYLIVSNSFRKEYIMLVFPHGAPVDDGSGFLEGDYDDGRRLLKIHSMEDLADKTPKLQKALKELLKTM